MTPYDPSPPQSFPVPAFKNSEAVMNPNLSEGERLFQEGKVEDAKVIFQNLLQTTPDYPGTLNNLGVIAFSEKNVQEAEKYFLRALETDNNFPDAYLNLSNLYSINGQFIQASMFLEKYAALNPNDFKIFNQLGFIYLQLKDLNKAQLNFEKSLELKPDQNKVIEARRKLLSLESGQKQSNIPVKNHYYEKDHPVVSVGLPVYNGGKYLAEAIESILIQDFEEFELIISDNNSNDQTSEICDKYKKIDKRIRYVRLKENIGMKLNFFNVLGLARAPYFMFATHDDLHEKAFISKCIKVLQADHSVSLVYPQTKLLNSDSKFLGLAKDHVKADQNDPVERFRHLIWELGLCNMVLGLFRTQVLKRTNSWDMSLFSDTLFLAEVTLSGKIIQIPEPLFIRRFTRNYNYKSPDERNAQLIADCDPDLFQQGISLPHCRLTYAHLDLINNSHLRISQKEALIQETIKCFKARYGNHMKYEIDRAVALISKGIYYWTWRNDRSEAGSFKEITTLGSYRISNLLKTLQEALLIYPERSDLFQCYMKCFKHLNPSASSSGTMGECANITI
jgi:glycosyltransferase involved in cell wall biosynthesis